jgi:Protein of unknown function (DUF1360)
MTLAWVHDPLWLLIYALSSFRLTRLWTQDTLPPLPALRVYVATRWGGRAWTELMDCPWCAGFWISLGVVLVSSSPLAPAWQWVAVPLAISAVVGLLAALNEKG